MLYCHTLQILGKDFDASGVSGIIYRSNGSAGPFAKLAKVLSIPWIMLADNDEQGRQTVGEVRNCGYSADVISSQVLLNSTTDLLIMKELLLRKLLKIL